MEYFNAKLGQIEFTTEAINALEKLSDDWRLMKGRTRNEDRFDKLGTKEDGLLYVFDSYIKENRIENDNFRPFCMNNFVTKYKDKSDFTSVVNCIFSIREMVAMLLKVFDYSGVGFPDEKHGLFNALMKLIRVNIKLKPIDETSNVDEIVKEFYKLLKDNEKVMPKERLNDAFDVLKFLLIYIDKCALETIFITKPTDEDRREKLIYGNSSLKYNYEIGLSQFTRCASGHNFHLDMKRYYLKLRYMTVLSSSEASLTNSLIDYFSYKPLELSTMNGLEKKFYCSMCDDNYDKDRNTKMWHKKMLKFTPKVLFIKFDIFDKYVSYLKI